MKRFVILPVLLLVLSLSIGCETKQSQSVNRNAIRVAVFKKLLPDTKTRFGPEVYFLAISGKSGYQDPGKSIMKHFQGSKLCIKPFTKTGCEINFAVKDKATGKAGMIISVGQIKVLSKTKAEVECGYFVNGRHGKWYCFTAALKDGKWTVVKQKLLAVS